MPFPRTLCLLAWLAAQACPAVSHAQGSRTDAIELARAYRTRHGSEILSEFAELLAMPCVASDTENIHRNARYIAAALRRRGAVAELFERPDAPPIVFGSLSVPGATRTLIVYVHYDGQPVDKSQWTTDPWTATLYSAAIEDGGHRIDLPKPREPIDPDWRLYARASGDDKAPIIAILAALDALKEHGIAPTSNIKFFFEGEEEAGSPHLRQYLEAHRAKIDADAWIVCDGPHHQSRRPQLMFGVRGITDIEITVYGATRYLHSGHYGNWAPNPALMLSQLLASMKDETGRVLVKGYYDSVEPLSKGERAALAAVPPIGNELRKELGLRHTEAGDAPYVDRLLLPSLNIRGFVSATVGKTARNVIPNTATASIDMRLVKGNDPPKMVELVEAHIRGQGYHIVREDPDHATRLAHAKIAKVVRGGGYPAARTSMDVPIIRQITRAAERAAGGSIIRLPTLGGSLPLYLLTDYLKKPVVIAPLANHDDNQHAPDENIRIGNLWYGIDLMTALFTMPD